MSKDSENIIQLLSGGLKVNEETEVLEIGMPDKAPTKLALRYLRGKVEMQKEEIESLKQNREQRKVFAQKIYTSVCIYFVIILVLVYLIAFSCAFLSDEVLIILISTTTANVIGLLVIVARYLFPRNDSDNKDTR